MQSTSGMTFDRIDPDTVKVTCKMCTFCKQRGTVNVAPDELAMWLNGAFIENALPYTSASDREMLMTGTHPKCWDAVMGPDPEDEEEAADWTQLSLFNPFDPANRLVKE